MERNIYLWKDFEKAITDCKIDEDSTRRKISELNTKINSIRSANNRNWEERIKKINEIRLKKIEEINTESEKSKLELIDLKRKEDSILRAYCKQNGHNYVLISQNFSANARILSPGYGYDHYAEYKFKCSVCKNVKISSGKNHGHYLPKKYKQEIPQEIYDDEAYAIDGKTFRTLKEEIDELKTYIDYLDFLKIKLCELFGHDSTEMNSIRYYDCKCCGKSISESDYIISHRNAKYKGVVVNIRGEGYYGIGQYIISPIEELTTSLPTFESYKEMLNSEQKHITQAEGNEPKKLIRKK